MQDFCDSLFLRYDVGDVQRGVCGGDVVRCEVCSVRCGVCGVWCVVCGVWYVVCGVWCMMWCVVFGVWFAVFVLCLWISEF
jgi:hypothetical protein